MRVLISFLGLLAVASAASFGYNYQPVVQSNSGPSFVPDSVGVSQGPQQSGYVSSSDNGAIGRDQGVSVGPLSTGDQVYQAPAELTKEFFTYTADESDFQAPANAEQLSNNLRKGLRVVFIKSPEYNGVENAALALAKQASQQETAIYVLNKQADINDLANKLNTIKNNNNKKPEVHFVKYRTPEDAVNAQNAIQGQYDQLGGVTSHHNGGVAPVLNFASHAPQSAPAPVQEPLNSYLPSSLLRQRA
ncbi:uncharacterized protein LOC117792373 [Drosophila innubila]|uniref:uncharacterized protein LOC117792373 n=1 Tax=Drosophila innubila TaxID=198719 RepID=UPI00148CEC94|nr:uncharacterized protein LOC117792373 [Drosophila innubila]